MPSLASLKRLPRLPAVLSTLVVLAVAAHPAIGAVHTVGASGCDFTTIQAAIDAAGTADGDTIHVDDATHTEQGITVNKNLTIEGHGDANTIVQAHAVENSATNRVFTVPSGKTVTLRAMTIRHGKAPDGTDGDEHGESGGGILNGGTLTVSDCTITLNRAGSGFSGGTWGGTGGCGGGLYTTGSLTMSGTTISSNCVGAGGAGSYTTGSSGYGGGIYAGGPSTKSISTSSIINNSTSPTPYGGGGIYFLNSGATLSRCTIAGNRCSGEGGGGILCDSQGLGTIVDLTNCTITGNMASGSGQEQGGGITARSWSTVCTLNVVNCTINGNTTDDRGGGICGYNDSSVSVINLKNSIIANNTANIGPDLGSAGSAVVTYNSQDYNLIGSTSGASIGGTTTHNITGQDPLLAALADNGGPTQTCALQAGSPAINTIPNGTNGMGTAPLDVDQRGEVRPFGTKGDMGAYEVHPAAPTVTTTTLSAISTTSAVCGGEVTSSGGVDVTARGVCWNTTGSPTSSDCKTADGIGTGSFTSSLGGLSPNTTYYVRAYATNAVDTSYGEERSFRTSQLTFAVTFQAGANGSIQGTTSQTVVEGGDCTAVTAVPADGYQFTGWSGDYTGTENSLTITNVTANMTVTASFASIEIAGEPNLQVTIQVDAGIAAVGAVTTGQTVPYTIGVQNVGNADANDVQVIIDIPENMEFVSARVVPASSAGPTVVQATVNGSQLVLSVGNVSPGIRIDVEVVFLAKAPGTAILQGQAESTGIDQPVPAQYIGAAGLVVQDEYVTIVRTTQPFGPCTSTGALAVFALVAGAAGLSRNRQQKGEHGGSKIKMG